MIARLVTNGCSYMGCYSRGNGHFDLSAKLKITDCNAIDKLGSCNSRIIRTTLKDSYLTETSTLYVVGLSFSNRHEIPVSVARDFEGRWVNTRGPLDEVKYYEHFWTVEDTTCLNEMLLKSEVYALEDILEDLMYRVLSMISDLKSRGHQVLVFQQPGIYPNNLLDKQKFNPLKNHVNIIGGLNWSALNWQRSQGIKFDPIDKHLREDIQHPLPGEHGPLNEFLFDYISRNKLI